jgi:hypothetical protein
VIAANTASAGELKLWTSGDVVDHDTSHLGEDAAFLLRADRLPADAPLVAENRTTNRDDVGVRQSFVSRH